MKHRDDATVFVYESTSVVFLSYKVFCFYLVILFKMGEKKGGGNYKRNEVFRFIGLFLSLCVIFFLIFYFLKDHFLFLKDGTAQILGFVLKGLNAHVSGAVVFIKDFQLEVIDECAGIFAFIIYLSAILAYPSKLKEKVFGLIGLPILYIINIVRLVVLALVGVYFPSFFEYAHIYLWQSIFIVFIILLFLFWIKWGVKHE